MLANPKQELSARGIKVGRFETKYVSEGLRLGGAQGRFGGAQGRLGGIKVGRFETKCVSEGGVSERGVSNGGASKAIQGF